MRSKKLWVSRGCVDLLASESSGQTRTGGWIPSSTHEPDTQRTGMDATETDSASQAAKGRRKRALVARTLAGTEKKAEQEERTIIFIDESGCYLLPIVVKSYAPKGCTPILHEYLSYKHISMIGAVTPSGRLFLTTYQHSITSQEVIAFLGQLLRMIPGLLLIIWDGIPTHRSRVVKTYLSSGAAQRIHLEQLPGYAPDLNPIEWVWSYLKLVDLANVACDTLPELDKLIHRAKKRLQRKPALIQAFIQDAGYKV